jgi:hypothetical protein
MRRSNLLAASAFALLWTFFASPSAADEPMRVRLDFVGAESEAGVDSNGDGFLPSKGHARTRGTLGIDSASYVSEFAFGFPAACPSGGSTLVSFSFIGIARDLSSLTGVGTAGFACPTGTGAVEGIITGGSGRFAGASGTWVLIGEFSPVGVMNQVLGTFEAEITVP